MHQDDSSAGTTGIEAQNKMSTAHWTLMALLKMAVVTLVCGFIAGEWRTDCCHKNCSSHRAVMPGLKLMPSCWSTS